LSPEVEVCKKAQNKFKFEAVINLTLELEIWKKMYLKKNDVAIVFKATK
jgi:hypothetical protein